MKTQSATFPLRWSAPELLRDKKFSFQSDIYSFGITAIEIFTRKLPFSEMGAMDVKNWLREKLNSD